MSECDELDNKHDFQYLDSFIRDGEYNKGTWSPIIESEWKYIKILMCTICEDKKYVDVSKEEYDKLKKGIFL